MSNLQAPVRLRLAKQKMAHRFDCDLRERFPRQMARSKVAYPNAQLDYTHPLRFLNIGAQIFEIFDGRVRCERV